jgi:predicted transcriptional regulator
MARITVQRALLLNLMLEAPHADWYGLELARRSGLPTGTVYPALAGLEQAGLLASAWEEVEPGDVGRPRRRLYRLVPQRVVDAEQQVAAYAHFFDANMRSHPRPALNPRGELA